MAIRKFKPKRVCSNDERYSRAYKIVEYAHESAEALHDAFRKLKGQRRGSATDEEQDVLRAMLVSAGAGLDSAIKQLFRDCMQHLVFSHEGVKKKFAGFVERELKKGIGEVPFNAKLLAEVLVDPIPIFPLSERYVYDLTGSSLQSADQLFSAAAALGFDPKKDLKLDENKLGRIFGVRNKIVHELDIDFSGTRRNRVQRKLDDMVDMTNELLEVGQRFVEASHANLPQRDAGDA